MRARVCICLCNSSLYPATRCIWVYLRVSKRIFIYLDHALLFLLTIDLSVISIFSYLCISICISILLVLFFVIASLTAASITLTSHHNFISIINETGMETSFLWSIWSPSILFQMTWNTSLGYFDSLYLNMIHDERNEEILIDVYRVNRLIYPGECELLLNSFIEAASAPLCLVHNSGKRLVATV